MPKRQNGILILHHLILKMTLRRLLALRQTLAALSTTADMAADLCLSKRGSGGAILSLIPLPDTGIARDASAQVLPGIAIIADATGHRSRGIAQEDQGIEGD